MNATNITLIAEIGESYDIILVWSLNYNVCFPFTFTKT